VFLVILEVERLHQGITAKPQACGDRQTAATKQDCHHDADDEASIALFGFFHGGYGHFRHLFLLVK
jgi:hypothetical protein